MEAPQEILVTEYSRQFDALRKNRMLVSYYKYGPIETNYRNGLIEGIPSLEKRIEMYKETGNTEFLIDVANFAMIEFMHPQHPDAHFDPVDDGKNHIVGQGINQMEPYQPELF